MTVFATPEHKKIDEDLNLDPGHISELMVTLERVFKIGVYYPSGHSMCDQAADGFLAALKIIVGKRAALRFDVGGGKLFLEGELLDQKMPGIESFLDLIEGIGVSAVVMDSNLTATDLHDFVAILLKYRTVVRGSRNFQQIVCEGMPLTISVEHIEFKSHEQENGDKESGYGNGDSSQPTIDALLKTLASQGLTPEEVDRCRQLLEAIPGYLREAPQKSTGMPSVSWAEVEKMLAQVVRGIPNSGSSDVIPPTDRAQSHQNLDALTSIFRSLGQNTEDEETFEALDLLLSQLSRPSPINERDSKKSPPQPKPMNELQPIEELLADIKTCAEEAGTEGNILKDDSQAEELAILLQMLDKEQKRPVMARIQKRLRDIGRTSLTAKEWSIAVGAARDFLDFESEEHTDMALAMVLESVRSSGMQSCLKFFNDIQRKTTDEKRNYLWPYFMNEILMEGRTLDAEAFRKISQIVGLADRETILEHLPRLKEMDAFKLQRCARGAVAPMPAELRLAFATLASQPEGEYLAQWFFELLKNQPRGWLARGVMPLIQSFDSRFKDFIIQLTLESGENEISESLAEKATDIISEFLPLLGARERHRTWVPNSFTALARIRLPASRRVLKNLLSSRQFLFFHVWPVACRHAAQRALDQGGLVKPSSNNKGR